MSNGAEGPFGAVLAGGESSRYGSPKALATVGGVRIIDRVIRALRQVAPAVILSANEPELFADLDLPTYPDEREGLGPVGGIYTTLLRAREAGRPGILAIACDMPFPSLQLLERLQKSAFGRKTTSGSADSRDTYPEPAGAPDIVVPASTGPRGIEPLCAAYRTSCLPAIEGALADGDRRMIGFHERVTVRTIPLQEVEAICEPERAFLNINTPEDRARAETVAGESEGNAASESGTRDARAASNRDEGGR